MYGRTRDEEERDGGGQSGGRDESDHNKHGGSDGVIMVRKGNVRILKREVVSVAVDLAEGSADAECRPGRSLVLVGVWPAWKEPDKKKAYKISSQSNT